MPIDKGFRLPDVSDLILDMRNGFKNVLGDQGGAQKAKQGEDKCYEVGVMGADQMGGD